MRGGRLSFVDLRQGEADVNQHPLAGDRRIIFEQADVDQPPDAAHVHLGQIGFIRVGSSMTSPGMPRHM
jgi:hypothetical protein